MMVERRLSLVHTTIMRWVKRFTPEFVKRWNRFAIQGNETSGSATGEDHAQWVCRLAPGRAGDDR
jgi:hypothetical protein